MASQYGDRSTRVCLERQGQDWERGSEAGGGGIEMNLKNRHVREAFLWGTLSGGCPWYSKDSP